MPRLNKSAREIHTTLQLNASRSETSWALRWKMPRSTTSIASTKRLKPIHKTAGRASRDLLNSETSIRRLRRSSACSAGHALEPADSLLHGRMRAEELHQAAAGQWIHDEHVGRRRIRFHGNPRRANVKLSERVRQAQRIRRDRGSRRVGAVLAAAR